MLHEADLPGASDAGCSPRAGPDLLPLALAGSVRLAFNPYPSCMGARVGYGAFCELRTSPRDASAAWKYGGQGTFDTWVSLPAAAAATAGIG